MGTSLHSVHGLILGAGLVIGCARAPDEQASADTDIEDRLESTFCVPEDSLAAQGIMAVVNDAGVSVDLLDRPISAGGVGLNSIAARNIVDARPLRDVAALDAVYYVGESACNALARFACNEQDLCRAPLSMVTWNIEHFPLLDQQTEDAVVEIIEERQPSIIGVQEVQDREAFTRVLARLDGYEGYVGARGSFTRVGILYRTESVDLVEVEDLFVDDSYSFPRSVLAATFEVRGEIDPEPLTVAVVHLKAFGDESSVARRRAAIEELRAWVELQREQGSGRVVIVGDWNDRLTDAPNENVFGPLSEPSARSEFVTQDAAEAGESSYIPFPSMIDHIMVTDEIFDDLEYGGTEVLYLDEVWSDDYEQRVSDHRPVQANFELVVRYDASATSL